MNGWRLVETACRVLSSRFILQRVGLPSPRFQSWGCKIKDDGEAVLLFYNFPQIKIFGWFCFIHVNYGIKIFIYIG